MLQGHCRWKGTMNWGKQILCLACFPEKCGNLTKTIPWCPDLLLCGKPNRAKGTTSYHLTLHAGNQMRRKSSSTQASSATKHRRVNGVSWARKSLDGAFIPDDRARSNQSAPMEFIEEPKNVASLPVKGPRTRSSFLILLILRDWEY